MAEGVPVTFDSYTKEDGSRKSEYGKHIIENGNEIGYEHIIRYDNGITADHVIASASVPINYDYTLLEVESYVPSTVLLLPRRRIISITTKVSVILITGVIQSLFATFGMEAY